MPLDDNVKFDRINVFDLRRQLSMKEKQSKVDANGCAWGHGKRKTSHVLARVKPGRGRITVNGMPMHLYFHLPS